jgi:hypothetical protein
MEVFMETRRRTILNFPRRLGIVCAVLLMVVGRAQAEDVTMALEDLGHGTYRLDGHLKVPGSPYDVWRVLTDYEHIANFVSSLRKSTVKESTTDRLLLEQEALGNEFVFSKRIRVVLQVTEIPYKRIMFEDVSHTDFAFYEGSWDIQGGLSGCDVVYRLSCKRLFTVPNILAKDALKKSAESLLAQVRAEILRRNKGAAQ